MTQKTALPIGLDDVLAARAAVGDRVHDDIVWSYQTPIPQAAGIAGLLCFYSERVELTIDGERQPASA